MAATASAPVTHHLGLSVGRLLLERQRLRPEVGVKCCRADSDLAAKHDADRRHPELRNVEPEHVGVLLVIGVERKAPVERRYVDEHPKLRGRPTLALYVEWENIANEVVALLRAEAGRDPYDRRLSDLIGELSTRSEEFGVRWAAHDVRFHRTGVKHFHHPIVGDLTLTYEALELPAEPGLTIFAYTAEPNSPSHDALNLLASRTSTPDLVSAVAEEEA